MYFMLVLYSFVNCTFLQRIACLYIRFYAFFICCSTYLLRWQNARFTKMCSLNTTGALFKQASGYKIEQIKVYLIQFRLVFGKLAYIPI